MATKNYGHFEQISQQSCVPRKSGQLHNCLADAVYKPVRLNNNHYVRIQRFWARRQHGYHHFMGNFLSALVKLGRQMIKFAHSRPGAAPGINARAKSAVFIRHIMVFAWRRQRLYALVSIRIMRHQSKQVFIVRVAGWAGCFSSTNTFTQFALSRVSHAQIYFIGTAVHTLCARPARHTHLYGGWPAC